MIRGMLKRQYARTMREAYAFARASANVPGQARVLDCGAGSGHEHEATFGSAPDLNYTGLEWYANEVARGKALGRDIRQCDLNQRLPIDPGSFDCAIAFSVLEHLLMPCSFLDECRRALRPGGRLVILTPNISTYFTALQVLLGRMPSSGPHPDSNRLLESEQPIKLSTVERDDVASETPQHRHLVVFSYAVLRRYLEMSGFEVVAARGFGYYPLPIFMQPLFERLDPWHCHQMVLVAMRK